MKKESKKKKKAETDEHNTVFLAWEYLGARFTDP